MLRSGIVVCVTLVGLITGFCVGLVGGAALVEFGESSCTANDCGSLIVRSAMLLAGLAGALMGFAKGMNLVRRTRPIA
ncbi:MAG: hypothetical protein KDJ29_17655 [Hyphomicrobiales bacterium]|nr:hypothetical protein [Hyphomicrobiales bacterium]